MTTNIDKVRALTGPARQRKVRALLAELHAMNVRLENLQTAVNDGVATLRSPDTEGWCLATWDEVGAALGISRQAAQQRYSRRGL